MKFADLKKFRESFGACHANPFFVDFYLKGSSARVALIAVDRNIDSGCCEEAQMKHEAFDYEKHISRIYKQGFAFATRTGHI